MVSKAIEKAFDFKGKVAIIVGGSSGMGKATALELAECGADIVVSARRAEKLEEVAKQVRRLGRQCLTVPVDITMEGAAKSIIDKAVKEFGGINYLVNTTTYIRPNDLIDVTEEDWEISHKTQIKAYWLTCKHAAHVMIKQKTGGAIVNISGIASIYPERFLNPYQVNKAAINHLTRVLGAELGKYNIRVNAITPGLTNTELGRAYAHDEETINNAKRDAALGRLSEPEEQARPIVFLLSDYASFITGHVLVIDGGFPYRDWCPESKTYVKED